MIGVGISLFCQRAGGGAVAYETSASDYDGVSDYQRRGVDLTGIADGKTGIISSWLRIDGGDGTTRTYFANASNRIAVLLSASNRVQVIARNSAATVILNLIGTVNHLAGATWLHALASWDLANGLGHIYVTDADETSTITNTNDIIDYTTGDYSIGAQTNGAQKYNGCLSEVFFHTSYLDISVESNRRKFIDANGKPVSLGEDGSTPLGVQPLLYVPTGDASGAGNKGTGGAFTTEGALDACTTNPSN